MHMSCTNRTAQLRLGCRVRVRVRDTQRVRVGVRGSPFLSTSPQYLRSTSCRCPEVRVRLKGKGYAKGLV